MTNRTSIVIRVHCEDVAGPPVDVDAAQLRSVLGSTTEDLRNGVIYYDDSLDPI
jgi:hypothetical protein